MKKLIQYCDVCGRENATEKKIEVVFTTEQTEGRSVEPYLEIVKIDICSVCVSKKTMGEVLFAYGAQGHNHYQFTNP